MAPLLKARLPGRHPRPRKKRPLSWDPRPGQQEP